MKEIKSESTKEIVRDSQGKFVKGNKEGRKFKKGSAGKPKGARNKKTLAAREFALDVLFLDPETGKRMHTFDGRSSCKSTYLPKKRNHHIWGNESYRL